MSYNWDQYEQAQPQSQPSQNSNYNWDQYQPQDNQIGQISQNGQNSQSSQTDQNVQTSQPPQSMLSKAGNMGLAAIGGLAEGGADVLETGVDAGVWALNKLGLIGDKTKQHIEKSINEDLKIFRADYGDDMFSRAQKQHPVINQASQLGVEIPALMASAFPGVATKGAGILGGMAGKTANLAVNTGINAATSAGMLAGTDQRSQDIGAMLGAATTPILSGIGSMLNSSAVKKLIPDSIRSAISVENKTLASDYGRSISEKFGKSISNVAQYAKQVNDEMWEPIKKLPGSIDTSRLKDSISFMLKSTGAKQTEQGWTPGRLMPEQQAKLVELNDILQQGLNDMGGVLRLQKKFKDGFNDHFFSNGKSADFINNSYKDLMTKLDDSISEKAAKFGYNKTLNLAKQYYKEVMSPLSTMDAWNIMSTYANRGVDQAAYTDAITGFVNKAFKNPDTLKAARNIMDENGGKILSQAFVSKAFDRLLTSSSKFNPNESLFKINDFIRKFKPVLGDEIKPVMGIKKILEDGGATPGTTRSNTVSNLIAMNMAGAAIGSGIGAATGADPVTGALLGAAGGSLGVTGGTKLMSKLGKLLDSPTGTIILKGIADGKPWTKSIRRVLESAPVGALNMTAQ